MFFRQLGALMNKNFILKRRLLKQTIWELLLPLLCGLLAGYLQYVPTNVTPANILAYFQEISYVYLLSLTLITLSFSGSCIFILNQIVIDKENKMRETLKIMSASRQAYTFSYFLTQGMFCLLSTIFMSFGIEWAQPSGGNPFGAGPKMLYGSIFLFGLALISLSMALTTLFTDSKLSPQVGMYLLMLPTSIFFFMISQRISIFGHSDTLAYRLFPLTYIMPNFSFSVIMLEFYIKGGPQLLLGLNVNLAWWCLGLSTPFYLLVYMYLDGVIPNAFGIRESMCFCLRRTRRQPQFNQELIADNDEERAMNAELPVSIQMQGLSKRFGDFKAVEGLNFAVYQNQVFCLLGHNGAGKTTAINMLTGMLQPSSGDAKILGRSLVSDINAVRQDIGLCQQFDILFDQLTVQEHLQLVCDLKCVAKSDVKAEITSTLRLVMLEIHKDKRVNMLSGGMKRKLSLGMSLVGKSSVIILDEPTSGLDVDSRREVWELIKQVKRNRCVILSTQHIEEADVLADRVCIMSHGKVIALDSPLGIKRKYGVGYNLIVEAKNIQTLSFSQAQRALYDGYVKDAQIDGTHFSADSSSENQLVYGIPFGFEDKMSTLLRQLESFDDIIVYVEITSLEDAYLKIVKLEDSQFNKDDAQIQNEEVMQMYQSTSGSNSFTSQYYAMFARRFIVFTREPRQWFLTVSPFINVLVTFLILYSFFNLAQGDHKAAALKIFNYVIALMFPYIMNAGYATTCGIYMLMPIEERMKQTRHILKISGMKTVSYWLGLFTADYILFLIPTAMFTILVAFSGLQIFGDSLGMFIGGMLGFGFAIISVTYLLASFFSNQDAAIKCNILVQMLVGTFLPLMMVEITGFVSKSAKTTELVFTIFYLTNPMFTFYLTNYDIVIKWINTITPDVINIEVPLSFGWTLSFKLSIIVFICQWAIFMMLVMWRDAATSERFRNQDKQSVRINQPQMVPNDDVRRHEDEVRLGGVWPIMTSNITKVYPNGLLAVCGNTFGVRQGQILGLLGPNGAGKSSTFSMLAMEQPLSSGEAFILQNNTRKIDLTQEGARMGMCPQYNSIWEQLTVRENLQFMARVKGLSSTEFQNNVKLIIQTLDLDEFMNVRAGNLSGGNKRKLTCALTLLVSPYIEFLDEPTTGVDPVSRRSLFRMIKQLQNSSILLTTHRMDEAEQLCDNIAIMINGRIVCYGSPNYLMQHYGGGYEVTITTNLADVAHARSLQQVEARLPGLTDVIFSGESPNQRSRWITTLKLKSTIELSKLFGVLSDLAKSNAFESFTATRTTLEQVFVSFARFQHDFQRVQQQAMPMQPLQQQWQQQPAQQYQQQVQPLQQQWQQQPAQQYQQQEQLVQQQWQQQDANSKPALMSSVNETF